MRTRKKGFTLIELLIVIAIIGILMSLSLFGIQGARKSSRDAKRKTDLESIRTALELFKADNGSYFTDGTNCVDTWIDINGTTTCAAAFRSDPVLPATGVGTYIQKFPEDPAQTADLNPCTNNVENQARRYWYISDGLEYRLFAKFEANQSSCTDNDMVVCTNASSCYYVQNP